MGIHEGLRGFCVWSFHSYIQTTSFWSCYGLIDRKIKHDLTWNIVLLGQDRANRHFGISLFCLWDYISFIFRNGRQVFMDGQPLHKAYVQRNAKKNTDIWRKVWHLTMRCSRDTTFCCKIQPCVGCYSIWITVQGYTLSRAFPLKHESSQSHNQMRFGCDTTPECAGLCGLETSMPQLQLLLLRIM